MKKLLGLLLGGIMVLSIGTSAFAGTGLTIDADVNNVKDTIRGSDLYDVRITTNTTGDYHYIYTPAMVFTPALLEALKGVLAADSYALLNGAVLSELAVAYWGADFSLHGVDWENPDWTNPQSIANNTKIIPDRTASYSQSVTSTTHNFVTQNDVNYTYGLVNGKLVRIADGERTIDNVTIYEIAANKYVSPIVLDLVGAGKLEASNGKYLPHDSVDFDNVIVADFYGDGFEIAMEWVGPNDGLLVAPKADGTVDMSCLFGIADGYDDGYQKLFLYADAKGIVKGEALTKLAVWQDKNGNGVADAGEVKSCTELGITSINVNHKEFVSSFEMNGKTHKMWDWWPSAAELRKIAEKQ